MTEVKPVYVRVKREPYTPRCERKWLTGYLEVTVKSLSYIHVGTGRLHVKVGKAFKKLLEEKAFNELVSELSRDPSLVAMDYMEAAKHAGKPCIPGSTLKGCVRARLEFSMTSTEGEVYACFRQASFVPRIEPKPGMHGWRHWRIWKPATLEVREPCDPLRTSDYSLCPVCNLFGAPGVLSKVMFGDLVSENARLVYAELDHNEKLELVAPGASFKGRISFENLSLSELGLLLIGLGADKEAAFHPILIGKSKYRKRAVLRSTDKSIEGKNIKLGEVRVEDIALKITHAGSEVKGLPEPSRREGSSLIYEQQEARLLIKESVNKALNEYPSLRLIYEAEKIKEVEP